jgi:hypothetical protein
MSDEHQTYINRCIGAVLLDGFTPSLAAIASPAQTVIRVVGDGQSVAIFDPQTGWVVIPPGLPN